MPIMHKLVYSQICQYCIIYFIDVLHPIHKGEVYIIIYI